MTKVKTLDDWLTYRKRGLTKDTIGKQGEEPYNGLLHVVRLHESNRVVSVGYGRTEQNARDDAWENLPKSRKIPLVI